MAKDNARTLTTASHHHTEPIIRLAENLLSDLTTDMAYVELCHYVVLVYDPVEQNHGETWLWLLEYDKVQGIYCLSVKIKVGARADLKQMTLAVESIQTGTTIADAMFQFQKASEDMKTAHHKLIQDSQGTEIVPLTIISGFCPGE
jgi:hypothetical protein